MQQRVILILLFFCSVAATAEDTVLKLYRPFNNNQNAGAATEQVQGRCDRQSQLIQREDAWRCEAKGLSFDPCFVGMETKPMSAVCILSPWDKNRVQINVSSPLNNEDHRPLDMSRSLPWAIELINGERCQATEPNQNFDSMPIVYRCNDTSFLFGRIQRCNPVWSMLQKTSSGVITAKFKKVWF